MTYQPGDHGGRRDRSRPVTIHRLRLQARPGARPGPGSHLNCDAVTPTVTVSSRADRDPPPASDLESAVVWHGDFAIQVFNLRQWGAVLGPDTTWDCITLRLTRLRVHGSLKAFHVLAP